LRARVSGVGAPARAFAIELVARESIQNAVDYGCGGDSSKQVRVTASVSDGVFRLVVSDEGPGFDADAVIERERGREGEPVPSENGLRIIAAYTDRYEYMNGGRTLVAEFILGEDTVMIDTSTNGIWSPKTDLVAMNCQSAKEELRSLIEQSEGEFLVDLSGVSMVDSKGLGLLIAAVNSLESVGRTLRVSGANSDLVELFKMMRLDRHMTIA
jgi:anti-sigma B factor antagonist